MAGSTIKLDFDTDSTVCWCTPRNDAFAILYLWQIGNNTTMTLSCSSSLRLACLADWCCKGQAARKGWRSSLTNSPHFQWQASVRDAVVWVCVWQPAASACSKVQLNTSHTHTYMVMLAFCRADEKTLEDLNIKGTDLRGGSCRCACVRTLYTHRHPVCSSAGNTLHMVLALRG